MVENLVKAVQVQLDFFPLHGKLTQETAVVVYALPVDL